MPDVAVLNEYVEQKQLRAYLQDDSFCLRSGSMVEPFVAAISVYLDHFTAADIVPLVFIFEASTQNPELLPALAASKSFFGVMASLMRQADTLDIVEEGLVPCLRLLVAIPITSRETVRSCGNVIGKLVRKEPEVESLLQSVKMAWKASLLSSPGPQAIGQRDTIEQPQGLRLPISRRLGVSLMNGGSMAEKSYAEHEAEGLAFRNSSLISPSGELGSIDGTMLSTPQDTYRKNFRKRFEYTDQEDEHVGENTDPDVESGSANRPEEPVPSDTKKPGPRKSIKWADGIGANLASIKEVPSIRHFRTIMPSLTNSGQVTETEAWSKFSRDSAASMITQSLKRKRESDWSPPSSSAPGHEESFVVVGTDYAVLALPNLPTLVVDFRNNRGIRSQERQMRKLNPPAQPYPDTFSPGEPQEPCPGYNDYEVLLVPSERTNGNTFHGNPFPPADPPAMDLYSSSQFMWDHADTYSAPINVVQRTWDIAR